MGRVEGKALHPPQTLEENETTHSMCHCEGAAKQRLKQSPDYLGIAKLS